MISSPGLGVTDIGLIFERNPDSSAGARAGVITGAGAVFVAATSTLGADTAGDDNAFPPSMYPKISFLVTRPD